MASYFLLNKQTLRFSALNHVVADHFGTRRNENLAKIDLVPVVNSSLAKSFIERLSLGDQQTESLMEGNLTVAIAFPDTLPGGNSANEGTGIMKVIGLEENHILYKIWALANEQVKINWTVSDFGETCDPDGSEDERVLLPKITWNTEDMELNRSQRFLVTEGSSDPKVFPVLSALGNIHSVPMSIINNWKNKKPFQGTFSISVVVTESPFVCQIDSKLITKNKKMLDQDMEPDFELVVFGGKVVKCHRAILSTSSDKLSKILQEEKCEDLKYLNAFLDYVYHRDISGATESVKSALGVLAYAIRFKNFDVVSIMQNFLVSTPNNDFSADDGVKLYVLANNSFSVIYKNDESWTSTKSKTQESSLESDPEDDVESSDTENEQDNDCSENSESEAVISENDNSENEEFNTKNNHGRENFECDDISDGTGTSNTKRVFVGENEDVKRCRIERVEENMNSIRNPSSVIISDEDKPLETEDEPVEIKDGSLGSEEEDVGSHEEAVGSHEEAVGSHEEAVGSEDPMEFSEILNKIHDDTNCRNLLKEKATEIILWQLKDDYNALLKCKEFNRLVFTPRSLMEITKLTIVASQNQI